MKIGVDLSVLQSPNRMRGIGSVLINFLNHLPEGYESTHSFVFFLYDDSTLDETLSLIKIPNNYYETQYLSPRKSVKLPLPAPLSPINKVLNKMLGFIQLYRGDSRFINNDLSDLDSFLQADPALGLPRQRNMKKVLILHDLIPYVLESEYMWGYYTARRNGSSFYAALRKELSRFLYKVKTKRRLRQADILISNSEHTKRDYIKYMKPKRKIQVCHLGADFSSDSHEKKSEQHLFQRYINTSWGDLPLKKVKLSDKPFLLYIGGADRRRRLTDLVGAFNNLRARGYDLRLVLTGDTLYGAKSIPTKDVSNYISRSSYIDDIVFLGFTSEEEKTWLYQNALAYVFPTVYEGFGLPILEAMQHGCPVITYKNSSIPEVAGDAAFYVNDNLEGILHATLKLINDTTYRKELARLGVTQSKSFSWEKSAHKILTIMQKV